jgi:rRNA maturation endonuclease Nob1
LNRLNENEEGTSMFGEQKRFTLKTPKPAPVAPADEVPMAPPAVPSPELPPSPVDAGMDMGAEGNVDIDMDAEEMGPEGDVDMDVDMDVESPEGNEEKVTFKTIQKLTGKLTQKIRTLDNEEGMTSENVKYVINMVLSSLDLKNLSEEDKDDIMSKFDEAEEREEGGDDMGGEDFTDDTEVEDIQADMDIPVESEMYEDEEEDYGNGAILDNIFGESKVDKVISKYFEVSKKEILESREKVAKKKIKQISENRKQMGAVIKLTETIEQELASKKFLSENASAKIVGITNRKNLVFENKGKQVRISPEGQIL